MNGAEKGYISLQSNRNGISVIYINNEPRGYVRIVNLIEQDIWKNGIKWMNNEFKRIIQESNSGTEIGI